MKHWRKILAFATTLSVLLFLTGISPVLAATFGNTGTGASNCGVGQGFGNATLRAGQFSPASSGTATSLSAIVLQSGTTGTIELAIYNSTGSTLLGNTAQITVNSGTNTYTSNLLSSVPVTAGTNYYLAIWGNTGTNINNSVKCDTTGGTQLFAGTAGYDVWADISAGSTNVNTLSISATYTPTPVSSATSVNLTIGNAKVLINGAVHIH